MTASAAAEPEGAPKPQRPATLTFTQAVLGLQVLAAFFATLASWGLSRTTEVSLSAGWIWAGGAVLMVALFYVAGKQKSKWGRIAGWVLQVPLIVAGLVVPAIAFIGVMFLVLWIMGLRIGGRIDRERAERLEAEGTATVGGTRDASSTPVDNEAGPLGE
jgi:membrane-bound ClpP family serine protease